MDILITLLLIVVLFGFLAGGVWIGLTLSGVAWVAMELFSSRPAGDAMAVTIWGSASSWTLTALPLFVWMGEILFRTRLSQKMLQPSRKIRIGTPRTRGTRSFAGPRSLSKMPWDRTFAIRGAARSCRRTS